MGRNICIFSDGTGQGGRVGAPDNTNVFLLMQACTFPEGDPRRALQETFYDPGLGADPEGGFEYISGLWYRLVSRATGLGITQNIKECYDALVRMHRPGDRIFLFGFSRGAYTVRSLGGVLSLCGVARIDKAGRSLADDADRRREVVEFAVEEVYKTYATSDDKEAQAAASAERRKRGDKFKSDHSSDDTVPYFIGVWDTVRALGIPGSSGLIGWRHAFHDATLNSRVRFARQALAIDEKRKVFEPVAWDPDPVDTMEPRRIVQAWFAGAHSDVGGGYPDPGLSRVALHWIVTEAMSIPDPLLVGDPETLFEGMNAKGPMNDETHSWLSLWRRKLRPIDPGFPVAHPSVIERLAAAAVPQPEGDRPYRPENLRDHPDVRAFFPRR